MTIHRELLCFFSSYYAAALNGKFIEAKNDRFEVDLSEEHLHAFADWIYTGSFNMEFLSETEECLYVNLYLFADQMDIIALRRSALSNLADQEPLSWESVKVILMNLPETSLLRKFALDSFIAHWEPSNSSMVPQLDNSTNSEYLLALYKFVGEVLTGVALRKFPVNDCTECPCCVNLCTYHEHENEEEWKESRFDTSNRLRSFLLTVKLACGQIKNAKRSVFGL